MRSQGLSYGLIAKALKMPKSTARYHASRAQVLDERRTLRRKRAPIREIQTCANCGRSGHNAAGCPS